MVNFYLSGSCCKQEDTGEKEKEGKAYKETDWSTADLLFSLTEALLGRD